MGFKVASLGSWLQELNLRRLLRCQFSRPSFSHILLTCLFETLTNLIWTNIGVSNILDVDTVEYFSLSPPNVIEVTYHRLLIVSAPAGRELLWAADLHEIIVIFVKLSHVTLTVFAVPLVYLLAHVLHLTFVGLKRLGLPKLFFQIYFFKIFFASKQLFESM